MDLFAKSHFLQSLSCPLFPVCLSHTGNRKGKLYIGKDRLMRDQIITLKDKSDRMIPVRIPVPVFVLLCRNPVNNQITTVIAVESSHNI